MDVFYKFIHTCMSTANEVVNFAARQGVLSIAVGLYEGIGRNVQYLYERYNVCRLDICQHNPSSFSVNVSNLMEFILISICACEHNVSLN